MLLFVFLAGPTAYICNLFTESLGSYLDQFFSASLNTASYPDAGMWPQLKRPRRVDGSFEDEPEVADAPDNGAPMVPKSKIKFLTKLGW